MRLIASIINFALDMYVFILLLRFMLQKLGANWYNPIVQLFVKLTNPIVRPMRYIIPGFKGFDLSILLLAGLVELGQVYVVALLAHQFLPHFGGALLLVLITLCSKTLYIVLFSIIIWSIMSWVTTAHHHPVVDITGMIGFPWLRLMRRFLPPLAGMDFSPMVVIFLLYLILKYVITPLMAVGLGLAWG